MPGASQPSGCGKAACRRRQPGGGDICHGVSLDYERIWCLRELRISGVGGVVGATSLDDTEKTRPGARDRKRKCRIREQFGSGVGMKIFFEHCPWGPWARFGRRWTKKMSTVLELFLRFRFSHPVPTPGSKFPAEQGWLQSADSHCCNSANEWLNFPTPKPNTRRHKHHLAETPPGLPDLTIGIVIVFGPSPKVSVMIDGI